MLNHLNFYFITANISYI